VLEFEEKTRHFCQEISAAMTGKSPSQNHKITQNNKRKSEAFPFLRNNFCFSFPILGFFVP